MCFDESVMSQLPPRSEPPPPALAELSEPSSWLSLVARTALGAVMASRIHARVLADLEPGRSEALRLILQSYAPSGLDVGGIPRQGARALGSSQWVLDAHELKRGISVSLVHLEHAPEATLVAWVQAAGTELEFDALGARPPKGAWFGEARIVRGEREIELRRTH